MWFSKKKEVDPELVLGGQITRTLKLKSICIELKFYYRDGKNRYEVTVCYAENPRGDYQQQGLEKKQMIEADGWPDLVEKVSNVLGYDIEGLKLTKR